VSELLEDDMVAICDWEVEESKRDLQRCCLTIGIESFFLVVLALASKLFVL